MAIIHIVQFSFKVDTTPEQIDDACRRFLDLKEKCIDPRTNQPYLKSVIGGLDNSPEGLQGGMTHAFVIEFEREEDRHHYLTHDPAHLEFGKLMLSLANTVRVVDFEPGKFL
ncbi:hypothetical protein E1B28_007905 [Marasmius oreades]|uniref:Stress-response A/B barrel domain-containing protein n=1 Tax=Marasmius oreades TaxID=181124 RepID=A0A9P7S4E9_9AGAR|nr:uncharacterized protein E1B28_007905 [Marasmius oreades]KAG7094303.1 hypothetical protein E1B28_007905 [Marasmius oreades]